METSRPYSQRGSAAPQWTLEYSKAVMDSIKEAINYYELKKRNCGLIFFLRAGDNTETIEST